MKLVFKIIYGILFFILASILLIIIYNFISLKILKKDYTNFFGYTVFEIASGSMNPILNENDIVLVKIGNEVNENDIITYKKKDTFITHRLIKKQANYYICKGDANNTNDDPIKETQILGRVVKVLPKLGVWKNVFSTPKVIISIVITVILFELAFTYKKIKFSDFSISGKDIIEEFGDPDEKK